MVLLLLVQKKENNDKHGVNWLRDRLKYRLDLRFCRSMDLFCSDGQAAGVFNAASLS